MSSAPEPFHDPLGNTNRIARLEFDIDVALTSGSEALRTPDRLMLALRHEVLATLDAALEDAAAASDDIVIPELTVELGTFDNPPDWVEVRRGLQSAMRSALAPYLRRTTQPSTSQSPPRRLSAIALTAATDRATLRRLLTGTKHADAEQLADALATLDPPSLTRLVAQLNLFRNDDGLPRIRATERQASPGPDPTLVVGILAALRDPGAPQHPQPAQSERRFDTDRLAAVVHLAHQGGHHTKLTAKAATSGYQHPPALQRPFNAIEPTQREVRIPREAPQNSDRAAYPLDQSEDDRTGAEPEHATATNADSTARLRDWCAGDTRRAETLVATLTEAEVAALIRALVPDGASSLQTALADLPRQARNPSAARRAAASALLTGQLLDLIALRNSKDTMRPQARLAAMLGALGVPSLDAAALSSDLAPPVRARPRAIRANEQDHLAEGARLQVRQPQEKQPAISSAPDPAAHNTWVAKASSADDGYSEPPPADEKPSVEPQSEGGEQNVSAAELRMLPSTDGVPATNAPTEMKSAAAATLTDQKELAIRPSETLPASTTRASASEGQGQPPAAPSGGVPRQQSGMEDPSLLPSNPISVSDQDNPAKNTAPVIHVSPLDPVSQSTRSNAPPGMTDHLEADSRKIPTDLYAHDQSATRAALQRGIVTHSTETSSIGAIAEQNVAGSPTTPAKPRMSNTHDTHNAISDRHVVGGSDQLGRPGIGGSDVHSPELGKPRASVQSTPRTTAKDNTISATRDGQDLQDKEETQHHNEPQNLSFSRGAHGDDSLRLSADAPATTAGNVEVPPMAARAVDASKPDQSGKETAEQNPAITQRVDPSCVPLSQDVIAGGVVNQSDRKYSGRTTAPSNGQVASVAEPSIVDGSLEADASDRSPAGKLNAQTNRFTPDPSSNPMRTHSPSDPQENPAEPEVKKTNDVKAQTQAKIGKKAPARLSSKTDGMQAETSVHRPDHADLPDVTHRSARTALAEGAVPQTETSHGATGRIENIPEHTIAGRDNGDAGRLTMPSTVTPAEVSGSADKTEGTPGAQERTSPMDDETVKGRPATVASATLGQAAGMNGADSLGGAARVAETNEAECLAPNVTADAAEKQMHAVLSELLGNDASTILPLLSMAHELLAPTESSERAAFWVAALAAAAELAQDERTERTESNLLAAFIGVIVPAEEERENRLRAAIARLGYAAPGTDPATRQRLRAALLPLVDGVAAPPAPVVPPAAPTPTEEANRSLTQVSGLVLFHPYLAMLFNRLEIVADKRGIAPEALPRALAVLWWLVDGRALPERPSDPLIRCLLGLTPDSPLPDPATLTQDDTTLIDGLIAAVINQWGRLGRTSPDGLRGAFIQRSGLFQPDDTAPQLIVEKAPYDMLLDSLPWSINLIALPWMPVALHVKWRGGDD